MRFVFSDSSAALFFASRLKFHWAPLLVPGFSAQPKLWGQWWTLIATTDTFHHDHPPTLLLITQFSLCGTTIINSYLISGKTSQRKKTPFLLAIAFGGGAAQIDFVAFLTEKKTPISCMYGGGAAQIDFDTFSKVNKLPKLRWSICFRFFGW